MTTELSTPAVDDLGEVVRALAEWQHEGAPLQLHPGDLGWYWQRGADATAAAVRTWARDDQILAVGLLDGPDLLRMTTAPQAQHDEHLAAEIVADIIAPDRGILPEGAVAVEAPKDAVVHDLLVEAGWEHGDPWTPLHRDLRAPADQTDLRIVPVGPAQVDERIAVHQSAFNSRRFIRAHWEAMVSGSPHDNARSLIGYDSAGEAVAMVTVWSAGPGRPGILEPMGVHDDHRGHGYGRAISVAAAGALREMGASSAMVCTPSDNTGAVATYVSAGFEALPERLDTTRTT